MRTRLLLPLLTIVATACAGSPQGSAPIGSSPSPSPAGPASSRGPAILPLIVSSELAKGPTRFLFSLTDAQNQLVAAPDVSVERPTSDVATGIPR